MALTTYTANFPDNNENDYSIITLLSLGDFDMLFMGDASVRSFEKIKSHLKENIEILKAGHHGAAGTLSNDMLESLNTKSAIISTGLNNYGHPNRGTIEILKRNNVNIHRTDTSNALKVSTNSEKYKIYRYNTVKRDFVKVYQKECR